MTKAGSAFLLRPSLDLSMNRFSVESLGDKKNHHDQPPRDFPGTIQNSPVPRTDHLVDDGSSFHFLLCDACSFVIGYRFVGRCTASYHRSLRGQIGYVSPFEESLVSILLIPGEIMTGLVRILFFQDLGGIQSGS